ncbi:solute carrier family 23 member 3-like isoform X3 [Alexandromys fortis]|uniref:solute carrier family 23 member 3-like isoform X3 n=1 Tax=Alexandromys fortis TaxID=100897 RepID=UPI0021524C97|nr:solute carrier family 23 member 3-like isoform X3 [Microtus fortis]XP_049989760.1 solute carrier family 23 member 3-like isoform X3 [Microtus fortis]
MPLLPCNHCCPLSRIPPPTHGPLGVGLPPGSSAVFWLYRLPLVQAPSLEFLIPALVLTNQKPSLTTKTPGNASLSLHLCSLSSCHGLEFWNTSLREVSGAVVVSGLLQGTIGLLGLPGRVFPYCGPLVLAPSLVVAGLSAHKEVAQFCSAHWGLALLLILLMVICSQHLGSCRVPLCSWRPASTSSTHIYIPVFRLLSVRGGSGQMEREGPTDAHSQVLTPVACVWIISALLGLSVIPLQLSDPTEAPWFWLPHPGGETAHLRSCPPLHCRCIIWVSVRRHYTIYTYSPSLCLLLRSLTN